MGTTIIIKENGTVGMIYHPNDALAAGLFNDAETLRDQRGAYVYPRDPVLRRAFKYLRSRFGNKGLVSEFTRAWRCEWVVVLPGEHVRLPGELQTRADAIAAEIDFIIQRTVSQ